jgi:arginyl-tRNA--protein-N-Asp/Glu arginylyltransferase
MLSASSSPSQQQEQHGRNNEIRLCGSSWAFCGYCAGARGRSCRRRQRQRRSGGDEKAEDGGGSTAAAATTTTAQEDDNTDPAPSDATPTETTTTPTGSAWNVDDDPDDDGNNGGTSKAYSILSGGGGGGGDDSGSSRSSRGRMDCRLYEQFLNRGWRRSGVEIYRPHNWETCCPLHTIRLAVSNFHPTRSQGRVLRRMRAAFDHHQQQLLQHEQRDGSYGAASLTNNDDNNNNTRKKQRKKGAQPLAQQHWVEASGILEVLRTWTEGALREELDASADAAGADANTKVGDEDGDGDDGRCAVGAAARKATIPPIRYKPSKVLPPSAVRPTDTASTITVFSTVCAAIAGQSRGAIDRTVLARLVVNRMVQLHRQLLLLEEEIRASTAAAGQTTASHNHGRNNSSNNATLTAARMIRSIECHAKSGQILVHVQEIGAGGDATAMTSVHVESDDDEHDNGSSVPVDRIAAWYRQSWDRRVRDRSSVSSTRPNVAVGLPPPPPYRLDITTLPAHESALDPRVHRLYWRYQHVVHNDPDPFVTQPPPPSVDVDVVGGIAAAGAADVTTNWGRNYAPFGWREKAEAMLVAEYGNKRGAGGDIGNDDIVKNGLNGNNGHAARFARLMKAYASFYDFLVENPFGECTAENSHQQQGTYHQHYTLNGDVLIAVGVVDILPTGLSSVYLFYDPDFAHQIVPLGRYAILKEIEWTREHGYPYYYLGYYIESCPKMRYKAEYRPSELLCPATGRWVDAAEAQETLHRDSPELHCCTLYKQKPVIGDYDYADDNNNSSNKDGDGNATKVLNPPEHDDEYVLAQIKLDIGIGVPVTLPMLQEEGQDLVRPLLQDFLDQAGHEIALQCTISFR